MPEETHDLFKIMTTTRSMRRLKPDPVPAELIRKILEAGVSAPSGGNMQRWRFLVVRDSKIKQTVGDFYKRAWDEVVAQQETRFPVRRGLLKDQKLLACWPRTTAIDSVPLVFAFRHRREGQRPARPSHCDCIECETTDRLAVWQDFARDRDSADIACAPREGGQLSGPAV
jgi:nitroreductase